MNNEGQSVDAEATSRDISRLLKMEQELRDYRAGLVHLQRASNKLSCVETFDDLCREAIALGQKLLGFDRMGLWFEGNAPNEARGVFGIDESGSVRDERDNRVRFDPASVMGRVFSGEVSPCVERDSPLYNAHGKEVGRGTHVMAALTTHGDQVIGCLTADNLISGSEITEGQIQLMDLFATTVGHLCTRKRAEEERERLKEQLRQSQKMEAVGQLAGGVAHDFNNLLQVMLGSAELMLDDLPPDGPASESIRDILKAGDRAKILISQLLAFSRRQVLNMRPANLTNVVSDMLKMLRRVIGEHITLSFESGGDTGLVRADTVQIGQILTNLCVNARAAMPDGGTIAIATANAALDETYCAAHPWARPGDYVLLSVTDTGHGMDTETLEHIFEPFFTTKSVGEGTGLGLSTVYGLVKQHEGLVHVSSEIGKGTVFQVYLPRIDAESREDNSESPASSRGGSETILLAEDDPHVRNLTKVVLERAGYTVLPASDGVEALELFEGRRDEINLVLLDVVMPRLGGRAVYERIREIHPQCRVLFASGYSMDTVENEFLARENARLIQKPVSRDKLLRNVREVLDERV